MPYRIDKKGDKFKLYNIKKKEYVNKEFNSKENFNKTKPITKWEKENTLDC